MPTDYINTLVDKGKGTKKDLESKWSKAKKLAADEGHGDEYDYITGIFNKMIGESMYEKEDIKNMTYDDYIKTTLEIEKAKRKIAKKMKPFDKYRLENGLTPDNIKFSDEFQSIKSEMNKVHQIERNFNSTVPTKFSRQAVNDKRAGGFSSMFDYYETYVDNIKEATTTAAIATYPKGAGNAKSNKMRKRKFANTISFKEFYKEFSNR